MTDDRRRLILLPLNPYRQLLTAPMIPRTTGRTHHTTDIHKRPKYPMAVPHPPPHLDQGLDPILPHVPISLCSLIRFNICNIA